MTVKELIEKLQMIPQDLPVVIESFMNALDLTDDPLLSVRVEECVVEKDSTELSPKQCVLSLIP
jgi:hypothetical protein